MGKREKVKTKLDALLGRSFKAAKLNSLLNLTVSRLTVLRNQRRVRSKQARSDVAELLRQGQQERALLRAEYVIKEENMLDAFAMVESYCHIVTDRSTLLENQNLKECPQELKEAVAGLIFAASRCGEMPELLEVRSILSARLGKEFVAAAIELRNNCGVHHTIIQKMSTKLQASLEGRTKVTKDIAAEIGITIHVEELPTELSERQPPNDVVPCESPTEFLNEQVNVRIPYRDAASAAQAAFESAAFAAAAARAAVELSRSESQGKGTHRDQSGGHLPSRTASGGREHTSSEIDDEDEIQQITPVPFTGLREKRIADYASEKDEEESEEEGERNFMGDQTEPVQNRGTGTRKKPEHLVVPVQGKVNMSSDEESSPDEEEKVVNPPMAAFRRQARPVNSSGVANGPVSMRTRRTVF